ncbi:hypothetical protein [Bradyrhizobium sp.]|jgi:hypothetical protein|uniref:hypothetical protein n=1 Tax=Bradyrhizobium sp. TaxID=376 RepID=UPI003C1AEFB3
MVLKRVLTGTGIVFATLVLCSGLSRADQYRPDEFLGMDLSRAALSPKPLGPPTTFAPVSVETKADRDSAPSRARLEPKNTSSIVIPKTRVAERHAERRRGAVRARLARRHNNPLDAEAFDARIQVWPCKSGGICNWKRQAN